MWFCAARSTDAGRRRARSGPSRSAARASCVTRAPGPVDPGLLQRLPAPRRQAVHRGVRQVQRAFQCPYHAWTYDFDGKLDRRAQPHQDARHRPGRVRPGHRRTSASGSATCGSASPTSRRRSRRTVAGAVVERLGDLEAIEHYGIDSLQVGRRIVYDVKANWKLIIENFMECYHCATIHPELTEVLPEFADGYAAQYFVGHGARVRRRRSRGSPSTARAGLDRIPGVTAEQDRRYYADHHQAAGLHQPGARPRDLPPDVPAGRRPHRSSSATGSTCRTWSRAAWTSSASVELFHRVNQQDFDACERCQPAMSSRAVRARAASWCPASTTSATFHPPGYQRRGPGVA